VVPSAAAVLFSAGLDSAVLLADECRRGRAHPLYVSVGLAWESAELAAATRLLAAPAFAGVAPLEQLAFTVTDLYAPTHWAIRGEPPGYDTRDEDVYLAGRNLVLLAKAGIWCALHGVSRIVLGPLAGNPFPDATPEFFRSMEHSLSVGLDRRIAIETPFRELHKQDVIRRGHQLGVPFELTLSCMNPRVRGEEIRHCGACSKCRERRDAFRAAGVSDPTPYSSTRGRGARRQDGSMARRHDR
jgi:7-cyano-7-deazaguanine synthase